MLIPCRSIASRGFYFCLSLGNARLEDLVAASIAAKCNKHCICPQKSFLSVYLFFTYSLLPKMPGAEFAHYEEGKEVVPSQDRGKYIVVARSSLESPEAVPCDPGSNTRYLRHTAEDTVSPIKKRRKLCWILPVSSLAILIVLAAVLGGIFGSRASKGKPSSCVSYSFHRDQILID